MSFIMRKNCATMPPSWSPATNIEPSSEFAILTRSYTPASPPSTCEELTTIALSLRQRVNLDPQQRFRLVGVGLSNFREPQEAPAQATLFE
jgi:DNA polymerase-4